MNLLEYLQENYDSMEINEFGSIVLDGVTHDGTPKTNEELLKITTKIRTELDMLGVTDREMYFAIKRTIKDMNKPEKETKKFNKEAYLQGKPTWYSKLIYTKDGDIKTSQLNFEVFLEESAAYKGRIYYDDFIQTPVLQGEEQTFDWDTLLSSIASDCEKELGINSKQLLKQAFLAVAKRRHTNPVINAVKKIRWDGEHRMENILIRVCGAPDTDLTRHVTRNFFYSMMNRLFVPGCSYASMPVLIQALQKTGKSEWLQRLLEPLEAKVGYALFMNFKDVNEKDIVHNLKNLWAIQFDESHALFQKNIEWIKSFITEKRDNIRLSYAKDACNYNRHCVFVANSNKMSILQDYSGNTDDIQRRFMILLCNGKQRTVEEWGQVWDDYYKSQVWAEAYNFYKNNPDYDYISYSEEETMEEVAIQRLCKTINETEMEVMDYLKVMLDSKIYINNVVKKNPKSRMDFFNKAKHYDEMVESEGLHMVDVIPTVYVKEWLWEVLNIRNLTAQKLTHVMDLLGWQRTRKTDIPGGYDAFERR
jgi:predicted P-loop ATPase